MKNSVSKFSKSISKHELSLDIIYDTNYIELGFSITQIIVGYNIIIEGGQTKQESELLK